MDTRRHFHGLRGESKGLGRAGEATKRMLARGGKAIMPSATERYQELFKEKRKAHFKKAMEEGGKWAFTLPGAVRHQRGLSKNAKSALAMMAKRKAAKEYKKEQLRVVVSARSFPRGGRIDIKGRVFSVQEHYILQVSNKDGAIRTMNGLKVGRYNPRSKLNDYKLSLLIDRYSPKPKVAAAGAWDPVTGGLIIRDPNQMLQTDVYGNVLGANVWGAASDNVWGTMSDNVWGAVAPTVWGAPGGTVWDNEGKNFRSIWNSGGAEQKNHMRGLWGAVWGNAAGLFGVPARKGKK